MHLACVTRCHIVCTHTPLALASASTWYSTCTASGTYPQYYQSTGTRSSMWQVLRSQPFRIWTVVGPASGFSARTSVPFLVHLVAKSPKWSTRLRNILVATDCRECFGMVQ